MQGVLTDLERAKLAIEASFYAVGILAAAFSAYGYYRNSRRERARWLFDLYQRFYERPDFDPIWHRIDDGDWSFLDGGNAATLAAFDDLLNFFEFIAILSSRGELRRKDVTDLFSYPLRRIVEHARVHEYLAEYDYEHLAGLLTELGYAGGRAAAT